MRTVTGYAALLTKADRPAIADDAERGLTAWGVFVSEHDAKKSAAEYPDGALTTKRVYIVDADHLDELLASIPTLTDQGLQLGNSWVSWDKIAGYSGEDGPARVSFWSTSIIAKGLRDWMLRFEAALAAFSRPPAPRVRTDRSAS